MARYSATDPSRKDPWTSASPRRPSALPSRTNTRSLIGQVRILRAWRRLIWSWGRRAPVGRGAWPSCGRGARLRRRHRDPSAPELLGPEARLVTLDPETLARLTAAFEGVDALIWCRPRRATAARRPRARVARGRPRGVRRIATVSGLSAMRDEDPSAARWSATQWRRWEWLDPPAPELLHAELPHQLPREHPGAAPSRSSPARGGRARRRARRGGGTAVVLLEPGHEGRTRCSRAARPRPCCIRRDPLARDGTRDPLHRRSHDDTRAALRLAGLPEAAIEALVGALPRGGGGCLRRHLAGARRRSGTARPGPS